MLQATFAELTGRYSTPDPGVPGRLWTEIESAYSRSGRHYHTLDHLQNLLAELSAVRQSIDNWDAVLFSLFYHDIVYNPLKSNNEEKSAGLAVKRMKELKAPEALIARSDELILATKKHVVSAYPDTNYFTDADLSILGKEWAVYEAYAAAVRKEYSIYPDLVYRPGRKKVLEAFLGMERIYKTDWFFARCEGAARENMRREIESL
jgi:predicted metal-dependent HD superfamily phosphohydrolase